MTIRKTLIAAGFAGFRLSRLHRFVRAMTQGCGVVLAFHRVRAAAGTTGGYTPNGGLDVTREFLDLALDVVRREGFQLVSLDEAQRRLGERDERRFAALTFDDGYRDTAEVALPVLDRHRAPFTVFCATGFIEGNARLWWLELEQAIGRLDEVEVGARRFSALTPVEKSAAFARVYWLLRGRPEAELLETIDDLARRAGVEGRSLGQGLFMSWSEIERLSRHPRATIGAHSVTHRRLAHWSAAEARAEMADSKAALERRLGIEVRHFAYPVGDPTSDSGHDAPRHAVFRTRRTPDRTAQGLGQRALAERRSAGGAAFRRAVLAVEPRAAHRRLKAAARPSRAGCWKTIERLGRQARGFPPLTSGKRYYCIIIGARDPRDQHARC
jgi:peptidoglycan/xylan/chitin deacetylase (PgdA/CDA1 family)